MKAININRDTVMSVGGGCGREHKTEHGHIHCSKCVEAWRKQHRELIECEEATMGLHDQLTRMLKELEEAGVKVEQELKDAEGALDKAKLVRDELKAELDKAQAALSAMRSVHKA